MTNDPPYGGRSFLIDLSAFARCGQDAVRSEWEEAVQRDQIVVCAPFLMEVLYATRNEREHAAVAERLTRGFRQARLHESTWRVAFAAQKRLASHEPGFHRRNPVDLLLAAVAHENGLGILHYDHHYDAIAAYGGLEFESRWITPAGTLDHVAPNPLAPQTLTGETGLAPTCLR